MSSSPTEIGILQSFVYTVDEYNRLFSGRCKSHNLLDSIESEDEYKEIRFKLLLLRKYVSKDDVVYIKKLLKTVLKLFPGYELEASVILNQFEDFENDSMKALLENGDILDLRKTIELELYGVHLHADYDKILKLNTIDSSLRFIAIRKYVETCEILLYKTYDLLVEIGIGTIEYQPKKAAAILVNNENKSKREIVKSPYWSNLYGHDLNNEESEVDFCNLSSEEQNILVTAWLFVEELERDELQIDILKKLTHPVTYRDWGDYNKAHTFIADLNNIGFSSYIRFNDRHDMAYVYLLENIIEGLVIQEYQVIDNAIVINLVRNEKGDWLIYSIGPKLDDYLTSVSPLDSIKKTINRIAKLLKN